MLDTRNRLGGIGRRPVTWYLPVTVDETVIGRLHTAVLVGDIAYPGTGDELLTFEDAAEQQADDHQHDGHFDQGETLLVAESGHVFVPGRECCVQIEARGVPADLRH